MDLAKYLTVLVLFFFDRGETGGHGEKHHTHVKVHIPEFIHHDHHKKVITIHHHHHKPKKEHHHHHHHHHKPHIPYGHHYHHKHKKTVLKGTETKHHGHHGNHELHGHHRHHGHHGYHGHQGHGHYGHHHHDVPSYSYEPSSVPSFEDDYASSGPLVPSYSPVIVQLPHVHGIQHTVKQVKVFDSLPGALSNTGKSHGYQVTEEDDEGDDHFTSPEGIQQAYPGTYGFISGVSSDPVTSHDPFVQLSPHSTVQSQNNDLFADSPSPTSLSNGETFIAPVKNNPFASLGPTQNALPSAQSTPDFSVSFHGDDGGFDNPANSYAGDVEGTNLLSTDDKSGSEDAPVSFQREAGVQESITTGGVETLTY